MKYSRKIDCKNNKVVLNDDSEKILEKYHKNNLESKGE